MSDNDDLLYDKEVLISGMEGTFLIEMANSVDTIDEPDVLRYRARMADALIRAAQSGLIEFRAGPWAQDDALQPLELEAAKSLLRSGEAWSDLGAKCVQFQVTTAGEAAFYDQ